MAKTVMIVSLTWSLMRSSENLLNGDIFLETTLFVALTALVLILLSPDVVTSALAGD